MWTPQTERQGNAIQSEHRHTPFAEKSRVTGFVKKAMDFFGRRRGRGHFCIAVTGILLNPP